MNNGDFKFASNFSFSSPSSSTNTSRSRPRLAKLRKPKSSFSQKEAPCNPFTNEGAGVGVKSSSMFGWSSDSLNLAVGGLKEDADDASTYTNGGKVNQDFIVSDESSSTKLHNDFEKLNLKGNAASVYAGIPFTCANMSYFEFKSRNNQDRCSDADTSSNLKTPYTGNFVSQNGFTEATLSNKLEFVGVESKVGGSNSGVAMETCSFNESIKNGTGGENKENMFFQGVAVSNTVRFDTAMPQVNGGLFNSSASTSTSSVTNIFAEHATNSAQKTYANVHEGEGFSFTGKFDAAISPNIKPSFNRKVKLVPKRHSGKQANLQKTREFPVEAKMDPASCGKESASKEFCSRPESPQPYSPMDMSPSPVNEIQKMSDESSKQGGTFESSEGNTQNNNNHPNEDLAYLRQQLNVGKNGKETHIDYTQGFPFEGIRKTPPEEFTSESEIESYKSATEDLELNIKNTTTASSCNFGSDGTTNCYFASNKNDTSGTSFIFSASPSSAKSASIRHFKTINKSKGFGSLRSSAGAFTGGQHLKDPFQYDLKADLTCSQLKTKLDFTSSVRDDVDHKPPSGSPEPEASTASQEPCEKWRLRQFTLCSLLFSPYCFYALKFIK